VSQACAVYLRTQDGQRQAPGPRREEGQHTSPCGVCGISTNTWHRPAKIGKGEREIIVERETDGTETKRKTRLSDDVSLKDGL